MRQRITVGDIALTSLAKRYVRSVLDSNRLSYGPYSRRFESKFARLHDSNFGIFTNSGTSSLQIAFAALKEQFGWQDEDEVIVPALTFIATSNTVIQNTLKPVFVDVRNDTYTLDPALLEEKITERTRAIVPVHLLGLPCDMNPILDIAKKHKLRIVEDSAECFLARYRGKSVGSFGDVGVFSTYVAHYIVTGVGGLDITSDPRLAVMMRSLANHGRDSIYLSIDDDNQVTKAKLREIIAKRFSFVRIGYSYRATELEAAIGLAALANRKKIVRRRKQIAHQYIDGLENLTSYLQLPCEPKDRDNNFMIFGIVVKKGLKEELVDFLEENGIETRDMPSIISQPVYEGMFPRLERQLPVANQLTKSGFYIGCHENITDGQVVYVIKTFHEFFKK